MYGLTKLKKPSVYARFGTADSKCDGAINKAMMETIPGIVTSSVLGAEHRDFVMNYPETLVDLIGEYLPTTKSAVTTPDVCPTLTAEDCNGKNSCEDAIE